MREEPEAPPPQKALKIMRREDRPHNHHHQHRNKPSDNKSNGPTDKSLEERESEYAKARARIFNETPNAPSPTPSSSNKAVENGAPAKPELDSKKKVEKKETHKYVTLLPALSFSPYISALLCVAEASSSHQILVMICQ